MAIPRLLQKQLAKSGFVTLDRLHSTLPFRRDGESRIIGANRLRQFSNLRLMHVTILNSQNQYVLNQAQVEWFFAVMPLGDKNRQVIWNWWNEDHQYIAEAKQFAALRNGSLTKAEIRAKKLILYGAREKVTTLYRDLALKLADRLDDHSIATEELLDLLKTIREGIRNRA